MGDGGKIHDPGRFLCGVAGLIRNRSGAYLLMRRSASSDFGGAVWECVTGRVNQGEGFEDALHREVREETGLTVRIVTMVGLSHFHRGERRPENELQGVIFGCEVDGPDADPTLSDEHDEYRWMAADNAVDFLTEPDAGTRWLRSTISRAEALWSIAPDAWGDVHRQGVTLR